MAACQEKFMVTTASQRPMAKKMGRPKSGRDDVSVKIDRLIAFQAKQVAGRRKTTVAELLSEMLRSPVGKAYLDVLKEMEGK
jgi:hypothetical protein